MFKTYTDIWGRERMVRPMGGRVLGLDLRRCGKTDDDVGGGGGTAVDEEKRSRTRQVVVEVVRDAFSEEFKALQEQKAELEALKKSVADVATTQARKIAVPGLDEEIKNNPFFFSRAIYAHTAAKYGMSNAWERFAPQEKEMIDQGLKYAGDYAEAVMDRSRQRSIMQVGDDTLGGFWVPEQIAQQFFLEMLKPATALFRLPINRLTGLTAEPIKIPKETGDLTAYWVGENEAITESNIGAGELQFRPHELGALVKFSAKILREASFGVEQFVRGRIANRFARAIDLAAFKGTGSDHQPLGLFNWGIQSHAASADPPTVVSTWEDLNDMINLLEVANVPDMNDWNWVMHAKLKGKFRKYMTGDASGAAALPFWTQDPVVKGLNTNLAGYPHVLMNQLSTTLNTDETEFCIGAWQQFIFLQWAGFELALSAETADAFAKRQVWIRAIQEVDCGPLQEDAFVLCNDYQVT